MKFRYNKNFTRPKQSKGPRSILQDGSRPLGLFWKEKKTPSYNRRNTVNWDGCTHTQSPHIHLTDVVTTMSHNHSPQAGLTKIRRSYGTTMFYDLSSEWSKYTMHQKKNWLQLTEGVVGNLISKYAVCHGYAKNKVDFVAFACEDDIRNPTLHQIFLIPVMSRAPLFKTNDIVS